MTGPSVSGMQGVGTGGCGRVDGGLGEAVGVEEAPVGAAASLLPHLRLPVLVERLEGEQPHLGPGKGGMPLCGVGDGRIRGIRSARGVSTTLDGRV